MHEEDLDDGTAEWLLTVAKIVAIFALAITLLIWLALKFTHVAHARDDGRYANSPLKSWFDQLASGKGLCCSFADGRTIDDPDIDMSGKHCKEAICVRIDGAWVGVPENAVVTEPNKYGPAVVWPYPEYSSDTNTTVTKIRCFLPGAGT